MQHLYSAINVDPTYLSCFLVFIAALFSFYLWRNGKNANVGPIGFPVIGHLPLLTARPHLKFLAWAKTYGPVFQIRMGSRRAVVVNGFEATRQALHVQSGDFAARPDFCSFSFISGGRSMAFGRYGPSWKPHKTIGRNALSMFTQKRSRDLQAHIVDEADIVIEELVAAEQPVNPYRSFHVATTSVVFNLCYGSGKSVREDKKFLELLSKVDKFSAVISASSGNIVDIFPWTQSFMLWQIKDFIALTKEFNEYRVMNQDRVRGTWTPGEPRNISDALFDAADDEGNKLHDSGLTKEHIYSLANDVVGAGQGTITAFLSWGTLYLVEFEEIQARLHAEIDREIGTDRQPTYEDRTRLPLCEAFFLETQRFSNPLPFLLPHAAVRDTTLCGQHVPAGAMVMCNMYSVLRDPEVWEHADKFDPTRFLDPQTGQIDRAKSEMATTFGMGKRRCMGEFLARLESFVFLVRLLQRCQFRKEPQESYDLEGNMGFSNEPRPYKIRVTMRE